MRSIAKYGKEQAKALAIAQREAWEREILINPASTKERKNG